MKAVVYKVSKQASIQNYLIIQNYFHDVIIIIINYYYYYYFQLLRVNVLKSVTNYMERFFLIFYYFDRVISSCYTEPHLSLTCDSALMDHKPGEIFNVSATYWP